MATYKGIQGYSVQTLASDPSPTASVEGQLWYNSTSSTYKISVAAAGAWASAPAINTARRSMAGAGTITAALIAGGIGGTNATETYNGSAWSTSPATLNTSRQYLKGDGTTTAFLAAGGTQPETAADFTETFNGSAWTEVGDLNTARQSPGMSSAGSTTASLIFGGAPVPATALAVCESWNGTSWTEVADLNTARWLISGAGTSTAALGIGGEDWPTYLANVESWNGTSWSEGADINYARSGTGGGGTQTSAICWGGTPNSPGVYTESWNGTAWTEVADLATKRAGSGRAGTSNANALAVGGYDGSSSLSSVEVWDGAPVTVKTVTTS